MMRIGPGGAVSEVPLIAVRKEKVMGKLEAILKKNDGVVVIANQRMSGIEKSEVQNVNIKGCRKNHTGLKPRETMTVYLNEKAKSPAKYIANFDHDLFDEVGRVAMPEFSTGSRRVVRFSFTPKVEEVENAPVTFYLRSKGSAEAQQIKLRVNILK